MPFGSASLCCGRLAVSDETPGWLLDSWVAPATYGFTLPPVVIMVISAAAVSVETDGSNLSRQYAAGTAAGG